MFFLKETRERTITLVLVVILVAIVSGIFSYSLKKPIPPGVDSETYINDANWILDNEKIPAPKQALYNHLKAYVTFEIDILIVVLKQFTGLNIVFPLFSLFQLFLIVFLCLTTYLVGSVFSRTIGVISIAFIAINYGYFRLFNGSSVSNLLAFSLLNLFFYFLYQWHVSVKKVSYFILLVITIGSLFFTHRYLTAPILLFSIPLYAIIIFASHKKAREYFFVGAKHILNSKTLTASIFFLATITLFILINYLSPIVVETLNSFFGVESESKFQKVITFGLYPDYIGPLLLIMGILGVIVFLLSQYQNKIHKIFPLFWTVILLGIFPNVHYFGITFYYERLIFLGSTFLALFAAILVDFLYHRFIHLVRSPATLILVSSFLTVLIVSAGVRMNVDLANRSNYVEEGHIEAFNILRSLTLKDETVISNTSRVSQTSHDRIISDRNIKNYSFASTQDASLIFFNPDDEATIEYLKNNGIRFIVLQKPSLEGEKLLQQSEELFFASQSFESVYHSADVSIFKLRTLLDEDT
ncbi:MAG: hypothetical protein A2898_02875 [Candidatus Kerfeldbacteria bacterium RIFCSPLOWO2_01_FULL_48_11]|uniref:Uncharacterized protein n=1 Tax=Candidatus Kerfeldbacteria bacterium RIFCSPLOWO2_01_FULL_48_11 TaxID=1798543 RepID=A0A1G2B8M6_9BACT|nr:MAG: hypothetical protein UY52_C0009G0040 [Parcubacteria group bacterium GW2011_GWC2_49_9]OGY85046.1 MAG: hypothetical protein A2898_02875 [Candidatus Kerfeldbacteria bacterium RIFCSPLOWO2_01_FULL_48_11]HCJ52886.1 hypothetical protein [Candidatus Kerfeldbacteria bacterium]